MIAIRWVISPLLLIGFGYLAMMNGRICLNNYLLKKKWTSAVPVIGGVFGMIGTVILPIEGSWKYCWIPLLADWGSLPVIVASLICRFGCPKGNSDDKL
jgi:hypothetical protein